MKLRYYFKRKQLSYESFIEQYQSLTANLIKEIHKSKDSKEKHVIDKLICMHSCTNMNAYNQKLMKTDIEELLKMHDIKLMKVQPHDDFNPNLHELRKPLYDNYQNYYVSEVIENGFVRGDSIIKKALVEVEGK